MVSQFLGEIGVKSRRVCPKERLAGLGRVVTELVTSRHKVSMLQENEMTRWETKTKKDERCVHVYMRSSVSGMLGIARSFGVMCRIDR